MIILTAIVISFHLMILSVVIFNYFSAPVLSEKSDVSDNPLVSLCIPARNEEKNIGNIIDDSAAQDWKNLEIIILDDQSEDRTKEIIQGKALSVKNIRLIEGKDLPEGWTGKNHACFELSQEASGEFIIFIDADCRISPWLITTVISLMKKRELVLLSSFPCQVMRRPGEYVIVPLMNWLLLTFLPLRKVYTSHKKSYVAANGQLMAFRKSFYDEIDGHRSVKSMMVEDMELGRICKFRGYRMMTLLGGEGIRCRMYSSLSDGIQGFSKNFYPGFNIPGAAFFLMLAVFFLFFLLSMLLPIYDIRLLFIPLVVLAERFIVSLTCRENPLISIVLHPVQMIMMIYVGFVSVYKSRRGELTWKGRRLEKK